MIASVIASPWFIRNAIHTGNPFYPLFNSVFHHISDITEHPLYCTDMAPVFSLNSISIRKILFNESFFETVTIPIRMFFEGNDREYQYFQGQLNPMLILFVPFILQPATRQSWMKIMAAFIFFYGYVAFFTTMHQVRYLLPIFPLLCILSVYGLHGLFHMIQSSKSHLSKTGQYCVLTLLVVLFSLNIKYLYNHFQRIDPFPYISKKESRVDYLRRHLGHYQSFEYINAHLPDNSRILTLFLGQRGYYLDRVYKHEPLFGMNVLQCMVKKSHSEASFKEYIDQMDITHILTRNDILTNYLNDRFAQSDREHLNRCVQKFFHQVMSFDNYTLWGRVEIP
ncbi:MAG: dolichyl-phosphate-mannose-protein mannosyltransferase protein [Candidatus Magnetoglobus multicellularis str. Araruama]|uniref:Dolichyl-phosphate-mannose-protein mannosyltransferase protein n=1 Tax=Candidatus Magnetoglobus multicellularis str. Araruama TaxID=890399 RepID=A0A1V1PGI6_9BACT|nr:MAG: dolichyl-phosphate-mannose-protein mannosyltransferase protein [Candidatus Magnetoglobus multicellularis str. Araruama]